MGADYALQSQWDPPRPLDEQVKAVITERDGLRKRVRELEQELQGEKRKVRILLETINMKEEE